MGTPTVPRGRSLTKKELDAFSKGSRKGQLEGVVGTGKIWVHPETAPADGSDPDAHFRTNDPPQSYC